LVISGDISASPFSYLKTGYGEFSQYLTVAGSLQASSGTSLLGRVGVGKSSSGSFWLDVSGNVNITGATSISNTANVTSNFTVGGTANITGATTISNTATITGATTISNTATITGATTISNTATITGATTISNTANITGVMTVSNDATIMSNLTVSNTIRTANGTNSAPTHTFTGDLTTGMYLPAVSNMAWTTAGVERIRIDSNGNVGIGRSDPTFRLDVSGTARTSSNLTVGGTLNCGAITSTGALALAANSITSGTHNPSADNTYTLGAVGTRWANVHATNFTGTFTGNITGSSTSCTGNSATATTAGGLTGSPNITVTNLTATTIYLGNAVNLYNQMMLGYLIDWGGSDTGPLWHTGGATKGVAMFPNRANSVFLAPRVFCRLWHFNGSLYQDISNVSYSDWIGVETVTYGDAINQFILYFI
jgi:carbonic anhydrase/acetyltransferase-like protein (isoleucine patch superfamily)